MTFVRVRRLWLVGVLLVVSASEARAAGAADVSIVAVVDTSWTMNPQRKHRAEAGIRLLSKHFKTRVRVVKFSGNQAQDGLATASAVLARSRAKRKRVFVFWVSLAPMGRDAAAVKYLHRMGVGVTYMFVDDAGPFSPEPVTSPDRQHVVSSDVELPLALLAEVRTMGRNVSARFPKWWQARRPCPSGAAVKKRRGPDGRVISCELPNGTRHGRRTAWKRDGSMRVDAGYRHGKLHGVQRRWHAHEVLEAESTYRSGVRHGLHKVWSTLGIQVVRGQFRNGRRDGRWQYWRKSGKRLGVTNFARPKRKRNKTSRPKRRRRSR